MGDVILKVENVSKLYRLGTLGTGTFGGDFQRFWKTKILGQEDPFLKIGQTNDRTSKEKAEFVWALQDINFEVKRGEVLGVIGKNGAGKSTLLKLLSRITSPTTGTIKSAGRMASLLEVGTGFHPELTGRENIFLNGAILGMTKKEIQSKFDEIVDFSGCELYIDTPTKRYSSGMTVRLGFAVAAFLDPEILVVDEVLAVGDAEFQEKAIGKMKDVSSSEGKTILFVSHNLTAIKNLCPNSLLLENGKFVERNSSDLIIERYLKNDINSMGIINWSLDNYPEDKIFLIKSVKVFQAAENIGVNYIENETIIEIDYVLKNHHKRVGVSIGLKHGENIAFVAGTDEMEMDNGEYITSFIIPAGLLNDTKYTLSVVMVTNSNNWNIELIDILRLDFREKKQRTSGYIGPIIGTVRPLILNKTIERLE